MSAQPKQSNNLFSRILDSIHKISSKPSNMFRSSPDAKILHIIRHGKASDYLKAFDVDRPLTEKGIFNNELMAGDLNELCDTPDLIISSQAARALHTAHMFARVMKYPPDKVQVNDMLYKDGQNEAYRILMNLPDEVNSVMIVGHNPDLTDLAQMLAGREVGSLPTSGVITIRFQTSHWSEIRKAKKKHTINFPKDK